MENLNRVLLENVLPAHVAEHFLGRNWKNEVSSNGVFLFFFLLPLPSADIATSPQPAS